MSGPGGGTTVTVAAPAGPLSALRAGSGVPLVTVHGTGGDQDSWGGVAARLQPGAEVWRWTRRAYRPGGEVRGPGSFPAEVADLRAVLDAARQAAGAPVHLLGASYGALLALHAALADADGIASLLLYEPPLLLAGPRLVPLLPRYRELLEAGDPTAATALFLREAALLPAPLFDALAAMAAEQPPDAEAARRSAIGALHDLEAMAADTTDVERWSAIRCPTLLLQGSETWSPVPEGMAALAAAMPQAQRVVWAGQSHFASATAPQTVAATVAGFLGRYPGRELNARAAAAARGRGC